ncbi:hypothetical protein Hanom_Chr13g01203181 [Helianthus anomalus]
MFVWPGHHSTNYSVWVRFFSVSILVSSCAAILNSVLWNGCTPVMDLLRIFFTITHKITHFSRVISKDIVNLSDKQCVNVDTQVKNGL